MNKAVIGVLLMFPVVSYGEIFRCLVDNLTVFKDTPCEQGLGQKIELEFPKPRTSSEKPSQYLPGDAHSQLPSSNIRQRIKNTKAQKEAAQRRCDDAKDKYKLHRSKMRAGYDHKKSNQMREKERLLKDKQDRLCQ